MKIQTLTKLNSFPLRFICIVLTFLYSTIAVTAQKNEKIDFLQEGDLIPEFTIGFENGTSMLSSRLQGKIVVLSFFATWCGPCLKELPHVQKELWEVYQNDPDFQLLVIGREHSHEELIKFKTEKHYTFPMIADQKREIFSLFASQNIPRMYLIDKKGKILLMTEGFNESVFKNFIKRLDVELKK
ncbi:MAG: TlpA family protein disulfide reductase [Prolixibacteraceae bacterium]